MYQGFSTSGDARGERAVTEVLGAILVFGLVLAVLALVQVSGIPAANERVEFEHSQFVGQDIQEFGAAVDRVSTTGSGESVAIEAGVNYPNRLLFINPGPVAGTFSADPSNDGIKVRNAVAIRPETAEFWSGSEQAYDTSLVRYQIGYNYYDEPPATNIEHGLVYDEFGTSGDTERIVRSNGNIIQGRQITLVAMQGELSTSSSETLSLNAVPLSAPMQRISVKNTNAAAVQIELATNLDVADWEAILSNELCEDQLGGGPDENSPNGICDLREDGNPSNDPRGYVTDVGAGTSGDSVVITMERSATYDLRIAYVGIGDSFDPEEPYYITDVRGSDATIIKGGSQELVVEVRDRFNNPVSGVAVIFTDEDSEDGTFQNEITSGPNEGNVVVTTDENGQASALFFPTAEQDTSISLSAFTGDLPGDENTVQDLYEEVQFRNLRVVSGNNDPTNTDINPNLNSAEGGSLVLVDVAEIEVDTPGGGQKTAGFDITFQNTGSTQRSISELRYSFAFSSKSGGTEAPDAVEVSGGGIDPAKMLTLGGQYVVVSSDTVGSGETLTIRLKAPEGSSKSFDSFAVLSAIVNADGESESALYFVDAAITNLPPTAAFIYTPEDVNVGEQITFDGTSSSDPEDDSIVKYEWDFDEDGDIDATGDIVTHTFTSSGPVDVTLTVTDSRGASHSTTETNINVRP